MYKIIIINHRSVYVTEDTIFRIRFTPSNCYQDVPVRILFFSSPVVLIK